MIRLVAVSGSLRRDSDNTMLLRAAMALAPPGVQITLYEGVAALPHFNPDIEHDDLPQVAAWRALLIGCDGILIACPEYAHGVPGAFKNALDWVVGCAELTSRPVALINTAGRAVHAQAALAEILVTMGWRIVDDACPVIPVAGKHVSVDTLTSTPALADPLRAAIAALARLPPGAI